MKYVFYVFAFLLLVYLLWPGPSSINDIQALPNAAKSTLSGDTWQVPNVVSYFSDNYRSFVTDFYRRDFQSLNYLPIPPIRLIYPPEFAFTSIKDQTQSTYLEEYIYPLRNSLYVNGYEPFYENGNPKFWGSVKFIQDNQSYYTKATMRFYPSSIMIRLLSWLGINLSIILLWKLGRRVIRGD